MAASKKNAKGSKTAHVLNLLTAPVKLQLGSGQQDVGGQDISALRLDDDLPDGAVRKNRNTLYFFIVL